MRCLWGVAALWVLPRDISDHCPLVLKLGDNDWGPKPFRFSKFLLSNKKLKKVVEDGWRRFGCSGLTGVLLKSILKKLKIHLRGWHKVEYGNIDARLARLVEDIIELDV